MADIETTQARLVVLSCGHTAWVHLDHRLGAIVECQACPPLKVDWGTGSVLQRKWSVVNLATFEVPKIIDYVDGEGDG